MKLKFFVSLVFLLALPTVTLANEIELRINGVGLGSSLATVKAKFGKAVSEKRTKTDDDECVGKSTFLYLNYSGLRIELMGNEKGQNLRVVAMKITSAKWKIGSSITLGASRKQLEAKFGKPFNVESDSDKKFVVYQHKGEQASANFTFQNGKLVGINWSEFLC